MPGWTCVPTPCVRPPSASISPGASLSSRKGSELRWRARMSSSCAGRSSATARWSHSRIWCDGLGRRLQRRQLRAGNQSPHRPGRQARRPRGPREATRDLRPVPDARARNHPQDPHGRLPRDLDEESGEAGAPTARPIARPPGPLNRQQEVHHSPRHPLPSRARRSLFPSGAGRASTGATISVRRGTGA